MAVTTLLVRCIVPALPFLVPVPTWLQGEERPAWPLPWAKMQDEGGGAQPFAVFPPSDGAAPDSFSMLVLVFLPGKVWGWPLGLGEVGDSFWSQGNKSPGLPEIPSARGMSHPAPKGALFSLCLGPQTPNSFHFSLLLGWGWGGEYIKGRPGRGIKHPFIPCRPPKGDSSQQRRM